MTKKSEKTREMILKLSYGLFAEKGFKQMTMKDVCEVTNMSRGGLYSHFPGTKQLFEAILEKLNEKEAMDFDGEIKKGISAVTILENALALMEDEMKHPEDSLSLAMYEYAETVDSDVMDRFTKIGEKKWGDLIRYGVKSGEFKDVDVRETVDVILYSYQGIRMWSRIIPMKKSTFRSITDHIRRQLINVKINKTKN
ncbi:MAG: TetR/AcrR family transcriptional regulator [Lachnospiraceae bacterium]|nr:TetR/AcrR family transcriptional regulator [Lachnospiraceae bacterium]